MKTPLLTRAFALIMALAFVVPYAKPVACDLTDHATTRAHEMHDMTRAAWADAVDAGSCHALAQCTVAHVAPILEPVVTVSVLPSHREQAKAPDPRITPNIVASVTPPPKA
jgi:hypothetical protein